MWRSETSGAHESFSVVRKGYDREAVDRFVADLRAELEQSSERIAKLEVELTRARQEYETLREDTRLALSDPERASKLLGQEASEVLKSANDAALGLRRKAESTAKDLVERARREAEEITRQAKLATERELEEGRQVARTHLEEVRQQGREILAMADSTASNTVEAAKREGRSLVFRAREHAANLTQQAENRAAQVREEISALDLERQHLIGILRSAQDLIRSSLSSLDTRPLTPGTSVSNTQNSHTTAVADDQIAQIQETQTQESQTQEPTEAPSDQIASWSTQSADIDADATKSDDSKAIKSDMTFAEVARLIELAAEQTAALELDDADEAFMVSETIDPPDENQIDTDPQEESSNQAQTDTVSMQVDPSEVDDSQVGDGQVDDSQVGDSQVDDSHIDDGQVDGNHDTPSPTETSILVVPTESEEPRPVADPTPPANHELTNTEFDDEIVVVERYRQTSTVQTKSEDPKSRLLRLEALFSELRDEAPEHPPAAQKHDGDNERDNPEGNQPDDSPAVDNSPNHDQIATPSGQPSNDLVDTDEQASNGQEPDQLAQKIRSALRDLFDPRSIDLSRRVKRITQDDLNKILATIRSSGREGAVALIDQMVNDSQSRAGDVRLLIARVVHAGSDFAALLGDRSFDPTGEHFDKIVEEIAIDLTDILGQATLVRALEAITEESELGEAELVARTNGIYREARRKLDELINDSAYRAFCSGSRLVPGATGYLWVTSTSSQPCADCEDNVLAGINPTTETFPTGHENPPAHPGCSCVIVPVFA